MCIRDRDWVFAACQARADHPDFFVRKAIGWILRDLAWVDPEAVAAFVASAPELSGLSKREALKNRRNEGDTLTASRRSLSATARPTRPPSWA